MALSKIQSVMSPSSGSMRKNIIMNGGFTVNQRVPTGTNSGIGTDNYHMHDRWKLFCDYGTYDMIDEVLTASDTPYQYGFRKAMKLDVTSAVISPSTSNRLKLYQGIEGSHLQRLQYGHAGAKSVTVSFWVKATKTGTNTVFLYNDLPGQSAQIQVHQYTIDASNTWEKKEVIFTGNTAAGAIIPDDSANGMSLQFGLGGGTGYTGGAAQTTWGAYSSNKEMRGQVNHADDAANNFYITGIQMELGNFATDFEHQFYSDELRRCKRYFQYVHVLQDYNPQSDGAVPSTMYRSYAYDEPVRANPQFNITSTMQYYANNGTATNFPSTPSIADRENIGLTITEEITDGSGIRGYYTGTISVSADF